MKTALIALLALAAYTTPALASAPRLTAQEQKMVMRASPYMPALKANIDKVWPDMEYPATLASLIEQESLWNPHAELCVPKPSCSREYGFGFGQLTVTSRFNVFNEVKTMDPSLRDWQYSNRFDPDKQLLSVVVKNHFHYKQCKPLMHPGVSTYACTYSSYNGGFGGVISDRRVCANTLGCDPRAWFGNVENTSMKAKVALKGYGQSFFQINRTYVRNLLIVRPPKYAIFPGFANLPSP